jgi:transposase-like protein
MGDGLVGTIIPEHLAHLDTEILKCYQYLAYKLAGYTNSQVALTMNISEATLYRWKNDWDANHITAQAKQLLARPVFESIEAAAHEVLKRWPKMLNKLAEIAEGVTFDKDQKPVNVAHHTTLEAIALIQQIVVMPALASHDDADEGKRNFAERVVQEGLPDPMRAMTLDRILRPA